MATYVYETIPRQEGTPVRRFEFIQSMKDAPLVRHPDTGEPIRRVISGGYGIMSKPQASSFAPSGSAPAPCAAGCACHSSARVPTP